MYASTIAAIDAALDAAREAGVLTSVGTAYDVASKLEAEAAEIARNNPGVAVDNVEVEIGVEGYRAWYVSVDAISVTTTHEDDETYFDGHLPETGATVTLSQGGRGGCSQTFVAQGA